LTQKKSTEIFKVTVESTCKGQGPIPTKKIELPYKYESNFLANQIKKNEENKEYFAGGVNTQLLQMFKITNQGPSNPKKSLNGGNVVVKIYVPVNDLLKSEQNQDKIEAFDSNDNRLNNACQLKPQFASRLSDIKDLKCGDSDNVISCKETGTCAVYTWCFNSNWPKGEFKLINVNMTFKGAEDEVSSYTVCTHLQVENKDPIKGIKISGITNLQSSEAGQAAPLKKLWPIIVGIVIVVVIAIIIAIACYKTNTFSKLRFFKDRIEEEEVKIDDQRRSMMIQ